MSATVWKMRHAGSPKSTDGLSDEEILEGLAEGDWEPDDEVQGPNDDDWRALETHPHFAEALADYEPPAKAEPPDESRLDFNPLIDVALVLLIFFMLTTAYSLFSKVLELPQKPPEAKPAKPMPKPEAEKLMVLITARAGKDGRVVTVDGKEVKPGELEKAITAAKGNKNIALLDAPDDFDWEGVTQIMDACAGAGIERVLFADKVKLPSAPPPDE